MGCDYSTRQKASPEDTLRHYEALCAFSAVSFSDIDYAAIKYAPSTVLTEGQVRKIVEKLQVNTGALGIGEFLESLKSGDAYDREVFFVAAYMLANGENREKCNYLLKTVVPVGQDTISRGQAELLFRLMCKSAVDHCPRITPATERSTAVEAYLGQLQRRREVQVNALLNSTLGRRAFMPLPAFCDALVRADATVLSSTGLRKAISKQKEETAQPQTPIETLVPPKSAKRLRFSEGAEGAQASSPSEVQSLPTTPIRPILKKLTIA